MSGPLALLTRFGPMQSSSLLMRLVVMKVLVSCGLVLIRILLTLWVVSLVSIMVRLRLAVRRG